VLHVIVHTRDYVAIAYTYAFHGLEIAVLVRLYCYREMFVVFVTGTHVVRKGAHVILYTRRCYIMKVNSTYFK
jgi:hypothetical protein